MTDSNLNISDVEEIKTNLTSSSVKDKPSQLNIIQILQCTIASVGIVNNFTVVVAFLKNKKLSRKIPNIFIINQVRIFVYLLSCAVTPH